MFKILVIGVDSYGLKQSQKSLIEGCVLVVGGNRLLSMVEELQLKTLNITPLESTLLVIEQALKEGDVAVLASGDPLFFGIGRKLLKHFEATKVEFFPSLSSLQEGFAKFKMAWDDAEIITLHGRDFPHLPGLLLCHPKSFIFTDRYNSPDILAKKLISYFKSIGDSTLSEAITILVAEDIGASEERLTKGSLSEIAEKTFSELNVFCLLVPRKAHGEHFGLLEAELAHSRGLITKDEVRAATLHKLRLPSQGVFWDVGAGSGSVSIEAARMNPGLCVYAVERKAEELANIRENIRRFHCYNIVPVAGEAPGELADLPDPDVVFVGGSGGNLAEIVAEVTKRLPKGGRLVINGVIETTVSEAPRYMMQNGLSVVSSTVSISRVGQAGEPVIFNPITIMVGSK